MEFCSAYEKYSNCLVEIIDQLRSESLSQEKVASLKFTIDSLNKTKSSEAYRS